MCFPLVCIMHTGETIKHFIELFAYCFQQLFYRSGLISKVLSYFLSLFGSLCLHYVEWCTWSWSSSGNSDFTLVHLIIMWFQRGLTFVLVQEQPGKSEHVIGVVKVQLSVPCASTFYFIYFNSPDYVVFEGMSECAELICQAGMLEALSPSYPRGLNPGLFKVPVIKIEVWELSEWAVIHSHTALLGRVLSYPLLLRELHKQVGDSQEASLTWPEKLFFHLSHSRLFYSLFVYFPSLVVPVARWPGVPTLGPSEPPCPNSHIWKAPWASPLHCRRVASLIGPEEIWGAALSGYKRSVGRSSHVPHGMVIYSKRSGSSWRQHRANQRRWRRINRDTSVWRERWWRKASEGWCISH